MPSGLPPIGPPAIPQGDWLNDISALLPVVFSMFILILAQSAATSRAYAMKYDDSFDENVDLVGLGLGNLAAGLSGTFVVNGSPTKTEMVDSAGGRSQVAQVTTGAIVVVVLLFLTVPLSYMPNAVLSAVVFLIGLKLIDYLGMGSIYRLRPMEFAVALITAVTVVIVGVEEGIILAIILSLIVVLMHVYKPHDRVDLRRRLTAPGSWTRSKASSRRPPDWWSLPSAPSCSTRMRTASRREVMRIIEAADPPLQWFALDAAAMGDVDYSGADTFRQIAGELERRGVQTRHVLRGPGRPEAAGCLRTDPEDRSRVHLPVPATTPRCILHQLGSAVGASRISTRIAARMTTSPRANQPSSTSVATREARRAMGDAARKRVSPTALAAWVVASDRPDPVDLILGQATSRIPELVPVRHGRMSASPFAFYRGGALVMAADIASLPMSGIPVQVCGDAHLVNFGLFASPERDLLFDINDFDETLTGAWEWDLMRLSASLVLAARSRGFSAHQARHAVLEAARVYRERLAEYASMRRHRRLLRPCGRQRDRRVR